MNIISEKYKLLEWLISVEDEPIIAELKELKKKSSLSYSEHRKTSATENLFIEAGLKDIEEGKTYTQQQVLQEVSKGEIRDLSRWKLSGHVLRKLHFLKFLRN